MQLLMAFNLFLISDPSTITGAITHLGPLPYLGTLAYIGPGAGFAFLGSGLVLFMAAGLAIAIIFCWPLYWVYRKLFGKQISSKARARRVVVLGLDGLDPKLSDKYMEQGLLPNLQKLAAEGSYRRLGTSLPALSPVAWSSFQTGVNPGAHNIFDFLTRDKRHCLPHLSSTDTSPGGSKRKFFGRTKAEIRLLRKSQPFWKLLGKNGVFSTVLRVPISYPPEKFDGAILSAMCTPDLRGTQGTFSLFYSGDEAPSSKTTGGEYWQLVPTNSGYSGEIIGPIDSRGKVLSCEFSLSEISANSAALLIGDERFELQTGNFSAWIQLDFKGKEKIKGICRFCLRQTEEQVLLYVSPINVDPEYPALPISQPNYFSSYLAKKHGRFGTLGFMEDTWALNDGSLDEAEFLAQTYLAHEERKQMFFNALDTNRDGLCACVFDASDRIQHMFWRYIDDQHPAPAKSNGKIADAIPEMYRKMDQLVAETIEKISGNDVLIVLSDHGFDSFRRSVHLNDWLLENGYLTLKTSGDKARDYFQDVDWSQTKAFAVGISGIFINRVGRELQGVVPAAEADALAAEIANKLEELQDPADGSSAIKRAYLSKKTYKGAYKDEAPDIIVGYQPGYRVSWEAVVGGFGGSIMEDNLRAWSGDHAVDPASIPGVLFSNLPCKVDQPHIVDLAPTIMDIFALEKPKYMEGQVVL